MGYVASGNKGGMAGLDSEAFRGVHAGVSIPRSAGLHELGGRSHTAGEGAVQRSLPFLLERIVQPVPGTHSPVSYLDLY